MLTWQRILLLLALTLSGCDAGPVSEAKSATAQSKSPLRGQYDPAPSARADSLSSADIAGTVGAIYQKKQDGTSDFACSGTLIAPTLFLTAGHCAYGTFTEVGSAAASFGTEVGFSQAPGVRFQVVPMSKRVLEEEGGAHDLAIFQLTPPVPPTIVANVAPIFLGDVQQALADGALLGDDALLVGYGTNTTCFRAPCLSAGPQALGADVRRVGAAEGIYASGSLLRSSAHETSEAVATKGDSGGPLFLFDPTSGEYVVAGVASQGGVDRVDSNGHASKILWNSWAPTGSIGRLNTRNAEWMASELGPDADGDLVLDEIDNCAPSRCAKRGKPLDDCRNPDQLDTDGDGVGDECDLCNPIVCASLAQRNPSQATHFSCFNPDDPSTGDQRDRDGDGVGDECDICPLAKTLVFSDGSQIDTDNDLVGDVCDKCQGTELPYSPCVSVGSCGMVGEQHIECLDFIRADHSKGGRCLQLRDSDGDGLANECDNCTSFSAALKHLSANVDQRNSNFLVEDAFFETPVGDECDQTPLLRLKEQEVEEIGYFPDPPKQIVGDLNPSTRTLISGNSWVGANLNNEELDTSSFTLPITFRHCACYDYFDRKRDSETCISEQVCDARTAYEGVDSFRKIDVEAFYGNTQEAISGHSSGAEQVFTPLVDGAPVDLRWEWFPLTQLEVPTEPDPSNEELPLPHHSVTLMGERYVGTDGFVASAVFDASADPTTEVKKRVVLEFFSVPSFRRSEVDLKPPIAGPGPCELFGCQYWLPWVSVVNPDDFLTRIRMPRLLIRVEEEFGLIENSAEMRASRVTDLVSKAVATQLDGRMAWVAPSELGEHLRGLREDNIAVLLPREGHESSRPLFVQVAADGTLVLEDKAVVPLLDGVSASAATTLTKGALAAYSASDRLVIIVGGEREHDVGMIRRYRLDDDTLEYLRPVDGLEPAAAVAGIAYDAALDLLYVLDRDAGAEKYRIVVHHLDTLEARQVWSVPATGSFEHIYLGLSAGQQPILVGANPAGYQAWIGSWEKGNLTFKNRLAGDGLVVDAPIAGHWDRLLPVRIDASLSFVPLGAHAFTEEAQCTGL